jgi:hypothetical protein
MRVPSRTGAGAEDGVYDVEDASGQIATPATVAGGDATSAAGNAPVAVNAPAAAAMANATTIDSTGVALLLSPASYPRRVPTCLLSRACAACCAHE